MNALVITCYIAMSIAASTEMTGLICNRNDVTIFRIPERLECNDGPTKTAKVKVEKKNLKQYKSTAVSLQVLKYSSTVNQNFFGAKVYDRQVQKEKLSLSLYQELLSVKACIGPDGQIESNVGSPNYECNSKWLSKDTVDKIYCRYNKGYVTKAHNQDTISNLGEVAHCKYSTGAML